MGGVHAGQNHTPKATVRPSTLEIAWAAGVYEGEGTCGFSKKSVGGGGTQYVRVYQNDPWLCYWFQSRFGGAVRIHNHTRNAKHYDCFAWNVSGARARGFLMTIYQFLSPRRKEQVRKALAE